MSTAPPTGGFTAGDFLRLPGLPPHTELIDGSLVFLGPQEKWHSRVINLLVAELDRQAPGGLRADREMTVRLAKRQAPEPDVVVVTSEAYERDEPSSRSRRPSPSTSTSPRWTSAPRNKGPYQARAEPVAQEPVFGHPPATYGHTVKKP